MNIFIWFSIESILLSLEINFIYSECSRDNPFLKNDQCISSCTREEINNNTCIINNDIVKTQWLNNVVFIKGSNFFYLNIYTSENNNLYSLVSCYPYTNERVMYNLNHEGYGLFNKSNPFINLFLNDSAEKGRYESEIFTLQFPENNNKEYLISISKAPQYAELYDLYKNNIYYDNVSTVFGSVNGVYSKVAPHFQLYPNKNIYLYGLLGSERINRTKTYYFYLKKINFTSIDIKNYPPVSETQRIQCSKLNIISCFKTSNNYILCFFSDPNYQYTIIVYNYDLVEQAKTIVAYGRTNQDQEELFFKCIHFFDEAGVFVYFSNEENPIPVFLFKKYSNIDNSIRDVYTTVSDIKLNNYILNRKIVESCDMIKVEDKKFYFAGVSINNEKIYIVSFINYKEDKFVYKIFSLDKQIYNYDFCEYVKMELYNNFLVLGANYEDPIANRSSIIIIFSYPNTTEVDIDLEDYLLKKNDTTINNLTIELNGKYIIDNNIFGYIYSGVQIIENCMDVNDIYIADINEIKIVNNYFLPNNKKIILKIPKSENYEPFICKIKYAAVVMEPEYFQYNQYPIDIAYVGDLEDSGDEETFYNNNKKNYVGKYSFYNLILNNKLTAIDCEDINCELCYYSNKAECITYIDVINVAFTEDTNAIDSNSINSNLIDTNSVEHTNPIDTNFIDANTLGTNSIVTDSPDTHTYSEEANSIVTNLVNTYSVDTTNTLDTNSSEY